MLQDDIRMCLRMVNSGHFQFLKQFPVLVIYMVIEVESVGRNAFTARDRTGSIFLSAVFSLKVFPDILGRWRRVFTKAALPNSLTRKVNHLSHDTGTGLHT